MTKIISAVPGMRDARLPATPLLNRIDDATGRWYYFFERKLNDDGSSALMPLFFPSVTTFLKNVLPQSEWLVNWAINTFPTTKDYRTFMDYAAHYGTFSHILMADLIGGHDIDLGTIQNRVDTYVQENRLEEPRTRSWADNVCADLYAVERWRRDYKVVPIAIELPLASIHTQTAGTLDLVCWITHNGKLEPVDARTKPENIVTEAVIVDYKSGCRAGDFYEEYKYQLTEYLYLWEDNFAEHDDVPTVNRTFNLSPKDWTARSRTYYNFTEQTLTMNECASLTAMRSQFQMRLQDRLKTKTGEAVRPSITMRQFSGVLNATADLRDIYTLLDLDEMLKRRHAEYAKANTEPDLQGPKVEPIALVVLDETEASDIARTSSDTVSAEADVPVLRTASDESVDVAEAPAADEAQHKIVREPESLLELAMQLQ